MEIEFYDEDKHGYFLEEFKKYSREPSEDEKEFFKSLIEGLVNEISEITGVSTDFKLYLAVTNNSQLDDDTPINRYIHGFSFANWMEGFDRDVIMIRAVKDSKHWKDCLIKMLAHEIAHQEFYNKNKTAPYSNLENIIFEGHAMNRAEQVAEKLNLGWKTHYRSKEVPDIDIELVIQALDEDRSYDTDNIFQNGKEPCPEAEGYQSAYLVVNKLLENQNYEIEETPNLHTQEIREIVVENLEKLSGSDRS